MCNSSQNEKLKKKITLWAADYVARFFCPASKLEMILHRKSQKLEGFSKADIEPIITAVVTDFQKKGFINDGLYAFRRARVLHERGKPIYAITMDLKQKGLSSEDIEKAFAQLTEEVVPNDLDWVAGVTYAKRRKLGPWRLKNREDFRQKDIASLARQGFGSSVVYKIIDTDLNEDVETIEE